MEPTLPDSSTTRRAAQGDLVGPKEPFLTRFPQPVGGERVWGPEQVSEAVPDTRQAFGKPGKRLCGGPTGAPWMLATRPAVPGLRGGSPHAPGSGRAARAAVGCGCVSSVGRVWGCVRPGRTQGHCVKGAFRTLSLSLRFDCGSESPFRRDFPPRLTHAASCV